MPTGLPLIVDCREPGRRAVAGPRLHPARLHGGDTPSMPGLMLLSALPDRRARGPGIGIIVTKYNTYRVPCGRPPTPGRRSCLLLASKVRNSPQSSTVLNIRPNRSELQHAPPHGTRPRSPFVGLFGKDRPVPLPQPRQRPEPRIRARAYVRGSPVRSPYRCRESAFGCHTHDRRLRLADVPRRGAVVYERIPGSCHPFATGWVPTTERIVTEGSRSFRHLRPRPATDSCPDASIRRGGVHTRTLFRRVAFLPGSGPRPSRPCRPAIML